MKAKIKYIILAIIIVFAGLFFCGWHFGHKKAESASNDAKIALNKEITRLIVEIGDKKTYIASIEQAYKTQKQAIKSSELSREELRKLNLKTVNELTRAKLRIDTLLADVSHNGHIITIHDTITINKDQNCILLPFTFSQKDEWLNLSGVFNNQGKLDISLKKDLFLDVWSGVEKKTKLPKVTISTNDPYIGIIDIKSAKFDFPKEKKYSIGLQIGYGISNQFKPTPYIGIGISRNIFSF
jgi:hypothetical protein